MLDSFDQDRWNKIKEDARRWWAGDLGRPLIQVRLRNRQRSAGAVPSHAFASFYPMSLPVEQIVDCWEEELAV